MTATIDAGLHYPIDLAELPRNWIAGYIGAFASDIQPGFACGGHNAKGEGIPHLRPMNVSRGGKIDLDDVRFVPQDYDERRLQKGDVLFNNTNSPELIGKTALVSEAGAAGAFSNHMTRLRFSEAADPKFAAVQLHYLWMMKYFLHQCVKHVNQASISSRDMARSVPLVVPPINEQHRIVAKIEELFSELDKGIESLKTAREQLKVYRQAVLKHAFEGKLTAEWGTVAKRAPWQKTTLGEQTSLVTSGSRGWSKYYSNEGDLFIRAQNLKHDRLDLGDVAFVKLPGKSEGMRTRIQAEDILITITGANVTKAGYVGSDIGTAFVSQHVALCRPLKSANTEFLYWYLISEAAGRKQLNEFAYGAGKPGLNLDNVRSVNVSLPSIEEQRVIVKCINESLSAVEDLRCIIDVELRRTESLRQSILKKAFSGQLVPQDPNDEPAAVLLERIKAEKTAPAARGRRKGKAACP